MTDQQGVLRRIEWRELFPWLILFRTFRIAIAPSVLLVATAAVILSPLGWFLADRIFRPAIEPVPSLVVPPPRSLTSSRTDFTATKVERPGAWRKRIPRAENSLLADEVPPAAAAYLSLPAARTAILDAYFDLTEPPRRLFQLKMTIREAAYYASGFFWTLALWAFPGGVITRRAVVQLASDSPPGIRQAIEYAGRHYHWYLLAPLYPLLGLAALAALIGVLGLVIPWSIGAASLLAGIVWLLVAIASLGALWLLIGLIFGWPLMWPAISAERGGDSFEAFSRSFAYVYGKPLHYFSYVVIAALFGALGWAVVWGAAQLVQEFGFWAMAWGERAWGVFFAWGGDGSGVASIRQSAFDVAAGRAPMSFRSAFAAGTTLIGLVVGLIQSVALAFRYTYFFAAASAIYLLLRYDVDEKEMDEVDLGSGRKATPEPTQASPTRTDGPTGA